MKSKRCNLNNNEIKNHWQESDLSYGDLVIAIGSLFIGAPYQAATLEAPDKEKLIVNLSIFDCTTFVETVLALARCASHEKITPTEFRRTLKFIRYRQGIISGYSSRLHYFTDWLRDNENKKILIDMSQRLGGKPRRKKIDFMTTHHELYTAINNNTQLAKMAVMEKNLSRKVFYIIEKNKLSAQKGKMQNGDVIAFAANQEGLDVSHTGFALWQGKNLHLLHASKKEGSVIISKKTIASYLKSNKKFTGIIVARPS